MYGTNGLWGLSIQHPPPCKLPHQQSDQTLHTLSHISTCPWPCNSLVTTPCQICFFSHLQWASWFPSSRNIWHLLEPLVHLAGISQDITLANLTWTVGVHRGTSFPYAKDSPDHKPQFIRVNTVGCLCIASSKHILGQLLHCEDRLPKHDSWREGPVTTLGHNTSHGLSRHIVSFLFLFLAWLHHQSMDGIATATSSLCFLLILLFLLLWSLCYSPTKLQYINHYDMFVVL